jgi:hypothetical protein
MATESFFSNASLAYLASAGAGKDGKAYSIKPNDGSGDFTFSRGSNLAATRVGPTGLIEKGRENLFLQSNNFDTSPWASSVTLTSGQSGYDGSSNAWKLNETAITGEHQLKQIYSNSGVNCLSIYAKAAERDVILFRMNLSGSWTNVFFNLTSGSVVSTGGFVDATITSVGNGWYRCQAVFNNLTGSTIQYQLGLNDTTYSYTGEAGKGILIQSAQLEIGLAATEVITTGATTGKAGLLEDEPRFDYSGGATCPSLLLEGSRTNLMTYSEIFEGSSSGYWRVFDNGIIEPNYGISPEGVQNSTKIGTSGGGNDFVYNSITISSGTAYTLSCFVKNIDATESLIYGVNTTNNDLTWSGSTLTNVVGGDFEPLDNGWYRIWITTTSTSTSAITRIYSDRNGGTGSIEIYGFQVEAGSYPTSYIPNHSGGSVTRGVDAVSVTGLSQSFPLTAYIEIDVFSITTYNQFQFLQDASNYVLRIGNQIRVGATDLIGNNTLGSNKFALSVDASGNYELFKNGTSLRTGTITGSIDEIKSDAAGYEVKQILVFPEALSDADCINITSL